MPLRTTPLAVPETRRARILGGIRLGMAALCAVALVFRFLWGLGSITFEPGNFFAYLTIQSNLIFVVVSAASGIVALRGREEPPLLHAVRAGVITCTITAGIVFGVLVQQSSARAIRVDVPWSDVVLHFILPTLALADWALTPRRQRVPFRVIPAVLVYTCGWGAVTMIRGALTKWYPYYFLDPDQTSGIGEFVLLSGAALAVFTVVGLLVVGVSAASVRRRLTRMERDSAGP